MSYATQADLESRYGATEVQQVSDRLGVGIADAGVVAVALADADNEIDGYIAARYTLPLESTPALIKRLACDIARYRLYSDSPTELVRKSYEDAVDTLKRLSSGVVQLVFPVAPAIAPAGGIATISSERTFTDDLLAGSLL